MKIVENHGLKFKFIPALLAIAVLSGACATRNSTRNLPLWKKKALQDVLYIASVEQVAEIMALDSVSVAPYMDQLWSFQDPTPGTPENEIRDEYERRLAHVYANFSQYAKLRKADRARVYLLFGPPEDIVKTVKPNLFTPTNLQIPRMEIWLYPPVGPAGAQEAPTAFDSMHPGFTKFVFVDLDGYGRYRQIYSNQPGETNSPIASNLTPRRSIN